MPPAHAAALTDLMDRIPNINVEAVGSHAPDLTQLIGLVSRSCDLTEAEAREVIEDCQAGFGVPVQTKQAA